MAAAKALLTFCEGAHDAAFVKRVFKLCLNAEIAKGDEGDGLKFSEYPAPFNQLFRTSVESHAAKDLSLDMSKKFFLPDWALVKKDWIILLFNAGGKNQIDKVKALLKDFMTLYEKASVFQQDAPSTILEARYLFLYDADYKTPNENAIWMQTQFASIAETEWELKKWGIKGTDRGVIQDDKALYIWAGDDGKGTLENILLPLYYPSSSNILNGSVAFVEETFFWNSGRTDERKMTTQAKKLKATLCAAGQGERPGRPLSAIIHDNVLGEPELIKRAQPVMNFANFVRNFIGLEQDVLP